MHDVEKEQDWINVNGVYEQFHVWGDNENYVKDTIFLMQNIATKCFEYPFYIHFEGYEDEIDSVLQKRDIFEIYYQTSGRTVLTMSDRKTYHAEIPSFTVAIPNDESLKNVFAEWFYMAQQNCMWLITQGPNLHYKNQFAFIDMSRESIILLTDHDAQGFLIITNNPLYREKEYLRLIFEE